ncbi:MAG TPA: InlB B-repeat-containing protein [Gemmatimonadaceae bacterium]|nr:InlB B-repeat-containing protein [Gemmatimonadaceae bacterium]
MNRDIRRVGGYFLAAAGCVLGLSCGASDDGGGGVTNPITSVSVSPTSATLTSLGATQLLSATVSGTTASAQVTWTSDAPTVVDIQGSGASVTATARSIGVAHITATSSGHSGAATITVAIPDVALTVKTTGNGNGVITSTPAGINCTSTAGVSGGTCTASFPFGSTVALSAVPASGHTFVAWTGGCTGTTTCSVSLSAANEVIANFAAAPVTIALSANPTVGGTVVGGGSYAVGNPTTVTATPSAGYLFVNWTEGGEIVSTAANYQFIATTNRTLVANFTQNGFTIAVSANPPAGGSVGGGGTYALNGAVVVTAAPNSGYAFTNWTEAGAIVSTSAAYQFDASANRTLVANFIQQTFTITLIAGTGGTVSGGGSVAAGGTVSVIATPSNGFSFVNWTENGAVVSTAATYQFSATANRTLTANFSAAPTFAITVSSNPSAGGTVSGGGAYPANTPVSVIATPNAGFTFANWTENGSVVSTSDHYAFAATAVRTLVANFTPVTSATITVSANPPDGGTVSGGGTFDVDAGVTVMATPAAGYTFTGWTENGTVVATNATYFFVVAGNRTLVANFSQMPSFTILVAAAPVEGGTVTGGGTFAANASVTVTATASPGFVFVSWREDGVLVSTSASYTFTATASRTLFANFDEISPAQHNRKPPAKNVSTPAQCSASAKNCPRPPVKPRP